MSSVADASRALARALRESNEVKTFLAARSKVMRDKQADKLIQEFRQRQQELQNLQLQGKKPSQSQVQALEQLFARLTQAPPLQEYMQAEQRLGGVIGELNRTILEACGIETGAPAATAPAPDPVRH